MRFGCSDHSAPFHTQCDADQFVSGFHQILSIAHAGGNLLQLYTHSQSTQEPVLATPEPETLLGVAQTYTQTKDWQCATAVALQLIATRPLHGIEALKQVVQAMHSCGNSAKGLPAIQQASHDADTIKVSH